MIAFYETGDYKQYTDYFLDRQLGRLKEVKDVIWHFKKQSGCMKFMQPHCYCEAVVPYCHFSSK